MQLEHAKTVTELSADAKQRIRDHADAKFANLYASRNAVEDLIKAVSNLAAGKAIPAGIQATWTSVQSLRAAQTAAIQSINAATTKPEIRAAIQTFNQTIQTL